VVVGHPRILEQRVDFTVSGQGFGVQIERKVGICGLADEDKFVGNGVEWIELAAGLLKSIQAARIVAEDKMRLADVAQRLSLQESQPGVGPDARGGPEGFQRFGHASQMHQHDTAIVAYIANAVGHLQRGEVSLGEGVGLKCVLVSTNGLKAHTSSLMRKCEQQPRLRRRLARLGQCVEDSLPGIEGLGMSPQLIKNVHPPDIRAQGLHLFTDGHKTLNGGLNQFEGGIEFPIDGMRLGAQVCGARHDSWRVRLLGSLRADGCELPRLTGVTARQPHCLVE